MNRSKGSLNRERWSRSQKDQARKNMSENIKAERNEKLHVLRAQLEMLNNPSVPWSDHEKEMVERMKLITEDEIKRLS